MPTSHESCFAVSAPGLAQFCAGELRALGIRPTAVDDAGVTFKADANTLLRANLWLRTASRVLVRLASFHAAAFHELERHAKRVPWERVVDGTRGVRLRVTCKKSKLIHSGAVAQRIGDAIAAATGSRIVKGVVADEQDDASDGEVAQLIVVRLDHDECTISADSSGELLHRRGYRQATAKAPLRETLAAAVLMAAGWRGDTPLVDPMCGAGTIPIEGALLAREMAPGLTRDFACAHWPGVDAARVERVRDDARGRARPRASIEILGSDRDAGAIAAAIANAARAGVAADIEFEQRPISAFVVPAVPAGLIATNPPYGVRVGDSEALRNLYAQFGKVARVRAAGWTLAMLSADRRLEAQLQLPLIERARTTNGGIPVRILTADIPDTTPSRV